MYRVLVEKPEGKTPLERARCRWEDGIKMDHREICGEGGGGGLDSPGSGQGLLAGCRECCDEPLGSGTMDLVSYLHFIKDVSDILWILQQFGWK
jgi:hypothetical protein